MTLTIYWKVNIRVRTEIVRYGCWTFGELGQRWPRWRSAGDAWHVTASFSGKRACAGRSALWISRPSDREWHRFEFRIIAFELHSFLCTRLCFCKLPVLFKWCCLTESILSVLSCDFKAIDLFSLVSGFHIRGRFCMDVKVISDSCNTFF